MVGVGLQRLTLQSFLQILSVRVRACEQVTERERKTERERERQRETERERVKLDDRYLNDAKKSFTATFFSFLHSEKLFELRCRPVLLRFSVFGLGALPRVIQVRTPTEPSLPPTIASLSLVLFLFLSLSLPDTTYFWVPLFHLSWRFLRFCT